MSIKFDKQNRLINVVFKLLPLGIFMSEIGKKKPATWVAKAVFFFLF